MEARMKALLAATLTALVLVSAAWASNVTPGQLAALSKRVTKLEAENAYLTKSLGYVQKDESNLATKATGLDNRISQLDPVVSCLQTEWNGQGLEPFAQYVANGFSTPSGNLTLFVAPAPSDGIGVSGYLVTSSGSGSASQC